MWKYSKKNPGKSPYYYLHGVNENVKVPNVNGKSVIAFEISCEGVHGHIDLDDKACEKISKII